MDFIFFPFLLAAFLFEFRSCSFCALILCQSLMMAAPQSILQRLYAERTSTCTTQTRRRHFGQSCDFLEYISFLIFYKYARAELVIIFTLFRSRCNAYVFQPKQNCIVLEKSMSCVFIPLLSIVAAGKALMLKVAELVPKHQGRAKKQQESASTSGATAGAGKSGKSGKKKKWGHWPLLLSNMILHPGSSSLLLDTGNFKISTKFLQLSSQVVAVHGMYSLHDYTDRGDKCSGIKRLVEKSWIGIRGLFFFWTGLVESRWARQLWPVLF